MSIIVRNVPSNSSDSNITEGFPPGDVTIVDVSVSSNTVSIKWTDPNNTVINGSTISTWAGTVLVRKTGGYPTSINDGTTVINNTNKNKYSSTYFTDSNLTNDVTYYYRFFTYNTNGIYNDSSNLVFTATPSKPKFGDESWSYISQIANSGTAQNYWDIGDEITVQLSGTYNMTITLQIWDFNHFDKADGSGKANICLGCKEVYIFDEMGGSGSNGWVNTYARNTVMNNILNSMPSDLRSIIKFVNIEYSKKGSSSIFTSNEKVFIPSLYECYLTDYYALKLGDPIDILASSSERIKYYNGSKQPWWLRDPDGYLNTHFFVIEEGGYGGYGIRDASEDNGIVFCFNI